MRDFGSSSGMAPVDGGDCVGDDLCRIVTLMLWLVVVGVDGELGDAVDLGVLMLVDPKHDTSWTFASLAIFLLGNTNVIPQQS